MPGINGIGHGHGLDQIDKHSRHVDLDDHPGKHLGHFKLDNFPASDRAMPIIQQLLDALTDKRHNDREIKDRDDDDREVEDRDDDREVRSRESSRRRADQEQLQAAQALNTTYSNINDRFTFSSQLNALNLTF